MMRKTYLMVSPSGNLRWLLAGGELGHGNLFERILDKGDEVYSAGEGVAFIRTRLAIETLVDHLSKTEVNRDQFFIADISHSDRAGTMVPRFWEFLRAEEDRVAAE